MSHLPGSWHRTSVMVPGSCVFDLRQLRSDTWVCRCHLETAFAAVA